jgi:hypothetical protein
VIIPTLLIELYGWTGFDPIASLFIAVLIAASVVPLVVDCGRVLCLDMGEKAADVRQALQEVGRLFANDGRVLIGSSTSRSPLSRAYRRIQRHGSGRKITRLSLVPSTFGWRYLIRRSIRLGHIR